MKLCISLLKKFKMPRGHIFRGKYRLVKEVTPLAAAQLRNDFAREEQNIKHLMFPYLSVEESHGHARALHLREQKQEALFAKKCVWKKTHVTIEERLRHLRVNDAWD